MNHSSPTSETISRISKLLLWIGIIVVGGYHFALHVRSVALAEPMGSWETTYAAIARAWPQQYQWSHFIDGHDGYGPGYPLFVRPFIALGIDIYVAHRIANLLALITACIIIVRLLTKHGCPISLSIALAAIVYAINAGSYSIQARPDFLVLLEIVVILGLGEALACARLKPGWRFGALFGLLGLAGYFTKAYTLFCWTAVLAYCAVLVDRRATIRATVIGAAIIVAGTCWFAIENPLYWMETVQGQLVQASPRASWLWHQVRDFAVLTAGLVVVIAVPVLWRVFRRRAGDTGVAPVDPARRYWLWQVLLAVTILLIGPGWHTGAYLTYFFHFLLTPLVMLAGLSATAIDGRARGLFNVVIAGNLAVLMVTAPGWPRVDPGWAALRKDIVQEPGRVAVDFLMEPIAREKSGTAVIGTGNTGYNVAEPFRIHNATGTVLKARHESTAYIDKQTQILFGHNPVGTIYLDCVPIEARTRRNGSGLYPKNGLAFCTGPEINNYRVDRIFEIRPYYFATNTPRQDAGTYTTFIVKLVRKPPPLAITVQRKDRSAKSDD